MFIHPWNQKTILSMSSYLIALSQKFKTMILAKHIMASVFWEHKRIILIKFLPQRGSVRPSKNWKKGNSEQEEGSLPSAQQRQRNKVTFEIIQMECFEPTLAISWTGAFRVQTIICSPLWRRSWSGKQFSTN